MPTACLLQPHLSVRLSGERLEVRHRDPGTECEETLREIPLRDLDRLVTGESVHFTAPAFAEILRRGIPIQFFSWQGQFLGNFLPAQNNHGLSRIRQYQRTLDPEFVLAFATRIVTAKLYNQRRVLQRLQAGRNSNQPETTPDAEPSNAERGARNVEPPNAERGAAGDVVSGAITWLDSLFASLKTARTVDEVRGYEGASTARYFQAWATFLPHAFPFERRSTRPPLNPVNACISFGSTLVYNEAVGFTHAHGLDPALGMLHSTEDGRCSLALDLIEPFRPVFVEALALDLFSHEILNPSHFEPRKGGVYLNEDGRRKFFLQYERRMERQFLSESVGHRTSLRQQLEEQAVMFKSALEQPDKYEPFLIN